MLALRVAFVYSVHMRETFFATGSECWKRMFDAKPLIGAGVLVYLTVALVARSRRPKTPVWSIMAFASFIVVATGLLGIDDVRKSVDVDVILFLVGMFSIVGLAETSGLLTAASYFFVSRFHSRVKLFYASAVLFGLLAAFAVNDTVALMGPAVAYVISRAAGIDPKAMFLLLAFSITIGSAMTPIGNPQNVLIASGSGMPAPMLVFTARLAVPTLVNLLLTAYLLSKLYGLRDAKVQVALIPEEAIRNRRDAALAAAGLAGTVLALVVNDFLELAGMPHVSDRGIIPFVAAAAIYPFTSNPRRILSRVDWSTVVFFITMFITVAGVMRSGVVDPALRLLLPEKATGARDLFAIALLSLALSQFLSNVPLASIMVEYMRGLGYSSTDVRAWLTLATASTIAGNLTLLGAASNIIILEMLERRFKTTITFTEFLRVGVLVTALNMLVYAPFLLL
ncbi:Citrate transporter [Thermofilum pendens Hrk 5]|uniref:Citrate transporter n=2 Tax=Thermofilum pendens TaxID=2269 RepID=A1S0E9_THEPD|nr:Citrate transporter [Thermofilum pendens Hrk 5]